MGVVLGVIGGGVVLAAILGALRRKPDDSSLWGNPKQAITLLVVLAVFLVVIVWAVSSMNSSRF